ncbi:SERTA domain-containing protein 3 [Marasmius crinis-equi]|uniref:SERTA domain-containing protein 3 n=1 Tax=Marasmius crinis-equi TaxID=585013 RepID=A0ABR3ELL1_9AGAR
MLPDALEALLKDVLGDRYVSQETIAPLLDLVIEMENAGEDSKGGIEEMEGAYMERLHRLVASKVAGNGQSEGTTDVSDPAAEVPAFPTDINPSGEDVVMEDIPAPTSVDLPPSVHPSGSQEEDTSQSVAPVRTPSPRPPHHIKMPPLNSETESSKPEVTLQPASPEPGSSILHASSPQTGSRSSPGQEEQSSTTQPDFGTSTTPILTPQSRSSPEYKTFVELMSTIDMGELPSFARFTADGVADRFIKGHMTFLLDVGEEKPGCWECLVFKWVDVESIWTSRNFQDQDVSKESRPDSIGWWFSYGRLRTERTPDGVTSEGMEKDWWTWWTKANPEWRVIVDGRVVPGGMGPWDRLRAPGPSGIVLFLVALRWWHDVVENVEEQARWELAVRCLFDTLCSLHQDALLCTPPKHNGKTRRRPAGALAPEEDPTQPRKRRRTRK